MRIFALTPGAHAHTYSTMVSGPAFIRQFAPDLGDNPQTLARLGQDMARAGQWARGAYGGHGSEPVTPAYAWNMAAAIALHEVDTPLREVPPLVDLLNMAVERWPGEWIGPAARSDPEATKARRLVQEWIDDSRGPDPRAEPLTVGRVGPALIHRIARPEGQELRSYFRVNGFYVDISHASGMTVEFGYSTSDKREYVSHYQLPMAVLAGRQLPKWFKPLLHPAAYMRRVRIPFIAFEIAADLVADISAPETLAGASGATTDDQQTKTTKKTGAAASQDITHPEYATRVHRRKRELAAGRSNLQQHSGEDHHARERHTLC